MPSNQETDHDLTIEISNTVPGTPMPDTDSAAYLVQIHPPGPGLGSRYILGGAMLVLGRDPSCDICINDSSVSRRHARFMADGDTFIVSDLNSTNGISVNKVEVSSCKLKDGDDLRLGNCIYRYLASGNVEAQYHEEIYRLSISDALTHIPNRRFLMQFLERELLRAARYQRPLALVLFDIDHFKTINDRFGHLGGDFTLRELAVCIEGNLRKEGLFARYGGEEFAIVLPEATLDVGACVAERVRGQVEAFPFMYRGQAFRVTVSCGVTAILGDELLMPEEFIRRADENLYLAKARGRNCVTAELARELRFVPTSPATAPIRP
jgi:diguanylate cyclase (GGDEF)-like protein